VDFRSGHWGTSGIVFFVSFGDVTHFVAGMSQKVTFVCVSVKYRRNKVKIALTQSSQVVLTEEQDSKIKV